MGLRSLFDRDRRGRDPFDASDEPVSDTPPNLDELLAAAQQLVADGALVEAVDRLAAINRRWRDPDLEVRLVDLRAEAAKHYEAGDGRIPWPPVYDDPFPGLCGTIPEVTEEGLDVEVLSGAVAHHGALIVRGIFGPELVAQAVDAIERSQASPAPPEAGDADLRPTGSWFRPLPTDDQKDLILRQMIRKQGGVWLADSPSATALILDQLHATGVTETIGRHLGERPFFSLQKSTLRRSLPEYNLVAWHQDGSFLDPDVRTMNIWVAMSACGGDLPTPALEVVPRRFEDILPIDGVMSPHSVSYDLVDELAAETPTIVPEFAPGDAMLFDEHFLHRTHLTEDMTEIRYALECWFFAPSHQSPNYTPLLA